ncbi:MAG TPA: winged helix-turn-helix domain-containing protein [Candidatus Dormibacteraeota bacterium]|nr:winged helix-turn-helix domain-containing protein [Candidatus Dormibacteraeota bacterium]
MADLDSMLAPSPLLIEGEPLDSPYAEDAQQWVGIYSELVSFTGRCLARQRTQPDSSAEPELLRAGDELQLRSHLDRLLSRLEFWRHRVHDLAGLELDLEGRTIAYQGRTAPLTRREAQLLSFLAEHPGKFFSASQLIQRAWHSPELSEEELRTYVVRLRRCIRGLGAPCELVNQARQGYTLRFRDAG